MSSYDKQLFLNELYEEHFSRIEVNPGNGTLQESKITKKII